MTRRSLGLLAAGLVLAGIAARAPGPGVPGPPVTSELRVSPEQGLRSRGWLPEGPFAPPAKQYLLDNAGDAPLEWSAETREGWIRLAPRGGTLAPGERIALTVAIDAERVRDLEAGQHRGEVLFRNLTDGAGTTARPVGLVLQEPGLRARIADEELVFRGPPGGPFAPEGHALELESSDPRPLRWELASDAPWLRASPAAGGLAPRQRAQVAVELDPEQAARLPEGEHSARLALAHATSGEESASFEARLVVRTPTRLGVAPSGPLLLRGRAGAGPAEERLSFRLANEGSPHALRWRVLASAAWLVPEREADELAPGATDELAVALDRERAAALPPGTHRGGLAFVNADDGLGTALVEVRLELAGEEGSAVDAASELPLAETRSVERLSQFGITWTFGAPVEAGRFVNGDWWVLGPALLVGVDPPSRRVRGRVTNGSMLDPDPLRGSPQGYDSATYAKYHSPGDYDPTLNVAFGLSPSRPLLLRPHASLVSSISVETPGARPQLRSAAVLTVLDRRPPADAFRPPYVGRRKEIEFRASELDLGRLGRVASAGPAPSMAQAEGWFERPWLDHVPDWGGRYIHPTENMPEYGREMTDQVGIASLLLQLDVPEEQKRELAIRLVQLGLDYFGIVEAGSTNHWPAGGGHHSGRKWPILLAGALLHDEDMLSIGRMEVAFNEDDQTFYVEETSPGVYNHGVGGYGSEHLGMAEWGTQHWKQLRRGQLPELDDVGWLANDYRLCCTANVWWGELLAARIMGLKEAWNHDALFDYQDRFLEENQRRGIVDWRLAWSPWPLAMWRRHRSAF